MSGKYSDCVSRQFEWGCTQSECNCNWNSFVSFSSYFPHHRSVLCISDLFLSRSAWKRSSQRAPSAHIVFVSGRSRENIRWVRFRIHALFQEYLDQESLSMPLFFQPKVRMYSNFERRTDIRTYEDKKGLFSGVSPWGVPPASSATAAAWTAFHLFR